MNQYYGAYPPQSLTPQQAAALGGWQNNQNLQQMQGGWEFKMDIRSSSYRPSLDE